MIVIQVSVRAKPVTWSGLNRLCASSLRKLVRQPAAFDTTSASLPTTSVKCSSTRSSTPTRPSPSTKGTRSKEDRRAAHTLLEARPSFKHFSATVLEQS